MSNSLASTSYNVTGVPKIQQQILYEKYISHLIIIAVLSTLLFVVLLACFIYTCKVFVEKKWKDQRWVSHQEDQLPSSETEMVELNTLTGSNDPDNATASTLPLPRQGKGGASTQLGLMNIENQAEVPNLPSPRTWTPSPPYSNEPGERNSKKPSRLSRSSPTQYPECSHVQPSQRYGCNSSAGAPSDCHQFCCCSSEHSMLRHSSASYACLSGNISKQFNFPNLNLCSTIPGYNMSRTGIGQNCSRLEKKSGCPLHPLETLSSAHQCCGFHNLNSSIHPLMQQRMAFLDTKRSEFTDSLKVNRSTQTLPDYILPDGPTNSPYLLPRRNSSYASLSWDHLTPENSLIVADDDSRNQNASLADVV